VITHSAPRADPAEHPPGGRPRPYGAPVGLVLILFAALLLTEPANADEARDAPGAVSLLRQAAQAGDTVSYSGTQVVTVWSPEGTAAVLAEVRHSPGAGTSYRVMGGQAPGSIRADEVTDQTLVDRVISGYEVELAGMDSVAGREAYVVDVRRDDGSLAARLWTDTATYLLLRREIYNEAGKMVRASGFLDVSVHQTDAAVSTTDPRAVPSATRSRSLPDVSPLPRRLGDELVLHDVNRLTLGSQTVTQLVYSDGLSNVSVFVQQGRLDYEQLDGFTERTVAGTPVYVADGVPQRATWACCGYVYTVVADVSGTSLETMVAALPHTSEAGKASFGDRVVRGLDRVGSWLNPFG
jgi:negative regulator of sigma E activity